MSKSPVTYRVRSDLSSVVLTDVGNTREWTVGEEFDLKWSLGENGGTQRVRVVRVLSEGNSSNIELEKVNAE